MARGDRGRAVDDLSTGSADNVAALDGDPGVRARGGRRERRDSPSTGRSTPSCTSPARRRRPTTWPGPLETLAVGSEGTRHALALAARARGPLRAGLDERGLRRPGRASPARDVLGQRQPGGAPQRLRRGQALRRGAHHGVAPHRGRRRRHRAHLQHLRAPAAARRRAGGVELPGPGHRGAAAHRVRRRVADPQPVLRRRRGGRDPGPARLRGSPAR